MEQNRALGRQGEEIVLGIERDRVRQLGFLVEDVVWTADLDPFANHDIKSIDDDGGVLWVEVKATTTKDGRFSWPVSEFQLAVRERSKYLLYRVYEAHTLDAKYRSVRDPIGELEKGGLTLDLERLTGDIGGLEAPPDV
jgi:hypothetical protein